MQSHLKRSFVNPGWAVKKAWLISHSLLRMPKDCSLLCSYPKSGNTWIRFFLFHLLSSNMSTMVRDIDAMDRYMPEFGHSSIGQRWIFSECAPIIKTHLKYSRLFSGRRAMLVVRDPRDIVISYWKYVNGMVSTQEEITLSDILRHPTMGFVSIFEHYESWLERADKVVRYEDIKLNPVYELGQLAAHAGISRSLKEIELAVEASSLDSMKKIQLESPKLASKFKAGHAFVRTGEPNQWKQLLSDSDLDYYFRLVKQFQIDLYQ